MVLKCQFMLTTEKGKVEMVSMFVVVRNILYIPVPNKKNGPQYIGSSAASQIR